MNYNTAIKFTESQDSV